MFKVLALAVLVSTAASSSGAQVAANEADVSVLSDAKLTQRQQEGFQEFSSRDYNGAFYIERSGGYQWSSRYNSLDAAKLIAEFRCTEGGSRSCELYATLVPKQIGSRRMFDQLNKENALNAVRWARETGTDRLYAAVAADGITRFRAWANLPRRSEAQQRTLRDCNKGKSERYSNFSAEERQLLDDAGFLDCKIVFERRAR
ncbi:MAG: hypothetical protein AAGF13_09735 [Pseudomonadota bacterium]